MCMVIIGYGLFQAYLQPWRTTQANMLDACSVFLLSVLLAGASMLVDMSGDEAELTLQGFFVAFIAILFGMVLVCFGFNAYLTINPQKLYGVFLCHHKGGAAVL